MLSGGIQVAQVPLQNVLFVCRAPAGVSEGLSHDVEGHFCAIGSCRAKLTLLPACWRIASLHGLPNVFVDIQCEIAGGAKFEFYAAIPFQMSATAAMSKSQRKRLKYRSDDNLPVNFMPPHIPA